MNANDFRRIVLGLRDTLESAHMGHPDFRVKGRIFASLNHDESRGMVVLTPDDQQRFVQDHPAAFEPESGAWGRAGCTRVHLQKVDEEALGEAATVAWQAAVAKGPSRAKAKSPAKKQMPATSPKRRRQTRRG